MTLEVGLRWLITQFYTLITQFYTLITQFYTLITQKHQKFEIYGLYMALKCKKSTLWNNFRKLTSYVLTLEKMFENVKKLIFDIKVNV